MTIQRKAVSQLPRRQKEDLIKKHERIGELLDLDPVPLHTLAWKERHLELDSGDCYPIVDALEKIALLISKPRQQTGTGPRKIERKIEPKKKK